MAHLNSVPIYPREPLALLFITATKAAVMGKEINRNPLFIQRAEILSGPVSTPADWVE